MAIRLERCGSSVISHMKSAGSWGGPGYDISLGLEGMTVRRGDLPSHNDSAPPKWLKSIEQISFDVAGIIIG